MICPACRKKVVFGSVVGEAWKKIHAGEWLYGGRPPSAGKIGDCPECGVRLEWEPGEERVYSPSAPPPPPRVHLSALRESPRDWSGRRVWMRALVVAPDIGGYASDMWRKKGETDAEMLARLAREQVPRVEVRFASAAAAERFSESARPVDGARAAWMELEARFETDGERRTLHVERIDSIWPPKD